MNFFMYRSVQLPSNKLPVTINLSVAETALRNRLDVLTDLIQFDLAALSCTLYSKSFISANVKQDALSPTASSQAKASNLLDVVLNKIKHEPQAFVDFVKILESIPSLQVQAKELVQKYQGMKCK